MAKPDAVFVCQSCGAIHPKWMGKCEACGSWNTLAEEAVRTAPGAMAVPMGKKPKGAVFVDLLAQQPPEQRLSTGISEFDRVCGGGLVAASGLLIGGDPGVGKSTLLLQAAAGVAKRGANVAYVSGEEAEAQIQERARRLGVADAPVKLAAEADLRKILEGLKALKPHLVVVDSVQTLWSDSVEAAPGTVSQVRACAHELVRFAKKTGACVLIVGHVTKDGQIAGPRVVEHLVDAVIYFEGERGMPFRILRAVKNRFGPTDEIGVFEMIEQGLKETPNPSALFLGSSGERASGTAVFAGVEGSRPVLVEIQALASPQQYGAARRAVVGWDSARLAMILAVLEARCGLGFAQRDVYLSVAGGLRITEPAADLAVAAALISALTDEPLPKDSVAFGEVALSGEIRPTGRTDLRLKEAKKLGFRAAFAPPRNGSGAEPSGFKIREITKIGDLAALLGAPSEGRR
jgi:DNA repair protein RadA/Sms